MPPSRGTPNRLAELAVVIALYAAPLFIGAALLFLVQPLIGKLLLPHVGGTPAVWNSCLAFFQAVLLSGYLYAHATTRRLGVPRQAAWHIAVMMLVPIAFAIALVRAGLPIAVPWEWLPDGSDYPLIGVLVMLAVAVGVPFFVLSTTAPLLQRWFADSGHRSARDPYFLYAASNTGSLVGLLGFPLLIEPWLPLGTVLWAWAGGVMLYVGLVVGCAVHGMGKTTMTRNVAITAGNEVLTMRRRGKWLALAALPSSLLLGVTVHLTTDLAPIPLLWVVPLALYLLSFILVFGRWNDSRQRRVIRAVPILLLFVVLALLTGAAEPFALVMGLHLAAFFGVCLLCHGELARDRPAAEHLTRFYFWLSLGGVLGGVGNAILAPLIFHRVGMVEYPLALVLAALIRPRTATSPLRSVDALLVLGLLTLTFALVEAAPRFATWLNDGNLSDAATRRVLMTGLKFGLPAVMAFALIRQPIRYALALGVLLLAGELDPARHGTTLHRERNDFGLLRVTRSRDGQFLDLIHGNTLHGRQRTDERSTPRPMTYYHPRGPIGRVFATLPRERVHRVGIVGLGIGSVAAYAEPGQRWTFFEIDPAVARIARNQQYFTFLASCRAEWNIVLGDARRALTTTDDAFDLLVIDAFSSDAIPIHLLTREALRLYVARLTSRGVLVLHVSNVHLDLPPLVARLAADHEPPLSLRYSPDVATDAERADGKTDSQWLILARRDDDLQPILTHRPMGTSIPMVWERVPLVPGPVWRDDFANVLGVWRHREPE